MVIFNRLYLPGTSKTKTAAPYNMDLRKAEIIKQQVNKEAERKQAEAPLCSCAHVLCG